VEGLSRLRDARGRDFPGRTGTTEKKKNCHDVLILRKIPWDLFASAAMEEPVVPWEQ
jgi:hypothetical protein